MLACVVMAALLAAVHAVPLGGHSVVRGDERWQACTNFPVLGATCVDVFVNPTNLTLMIALTVQNKTVWSDEIDADHLCLDDSSLLELLTLIPALAPFKSLIDDLIAALGFIPGEVFSVCFDILKLNVQDHEATGCVNLNAVLMCWEGRCLANTTRSLGCFDLHY
jgi:hypothetical protein